MPVLLENLLLHTVKGGDLKRFGLARKAMKAMKAMKAIKATNAMKAMK